MPVTQFSNGNSDGWTAGQSSTDKGSFFGATPVNRQAAPTALTTTPTTAELKAAVDGLRLALVNYGLIA